MLAKYELLIPLTVEPMVFCEFGDQPVTEYDLSTSNAAATAETGYWS
jgi:hypothetical protein